MEGKKQNICGDRLRNGATVGKNITIFELAAPADERGVMPPRYNGGVMCDCRKELTEDKDGLIAAFIAKRYKGAAVDKIEFDAVAFPLVRSESGSLKMRCVTTSNLKVMVAGKKRPVEVPIMHSFCPFCGVKYEGDAADPEEVMA